MITYQVDRAKWAKMSLLEQMGNISSEVGRAINAKKQHNIENMDNAIIRALDLFDATTEGLVSVKSVRTKEVLRSKDQFLSVIYKKNTSIKELDSIDRYFTQYALAARLNK